MYYNPINLLNHFLHGEVGLGSSAEVNKWTYLFLLNRPTSVPEWPQAAILQFDKNKKKTLCCLALSLSYNVCELLAPQKHQRDWSDGEENVAYCIWTMSDPVRRWALSKSSQQGDFSAFVFSCWQLLSTHTPQTPPIFLCDCLRRQFGAFSFYSSHCKYGLCEMCVLSVEILELR